MRKQPRNTVDLLQPTGRNLGEDDPSLRCGPAGRQPATSGARGAYWEAAGQIPGRRSASGARSFEHPTDRHLGVDRLWRRSQRAHGARRTRRADRSRFRLLPRDRRHSARTPRCPRSGRAGLHRRPWPRSTGRGPPPDYERTAATSSSCLRRPRSPWGLLAPRLDLDSVRPERATSERVQPPPRARRAGSLDPRPSWFPNRGAPPTPERWGFWRRQPGTHRSRRFRSNDASRHARNPERAVLLDTLTFAMGCARTRYRAGSSRC